MPLQKSLTLDNEITLTSAYIVVVYTFANYNSSEVTVGVAIYKDSTAYGNGSPEVVTLEHVSSGSDFNSYFAESVLDDADKTMLTQAEQWLLTENMYSGATVV